MRWGRGDGGGDGLRVAEWRRGESRAGQEAGWRERVAGGARGGGGETREERHAPHKECSVGIPDRRSGGGGGDSPLAHVDTSQLVAQRGLLGGTGRPVSILQRLVSPLNGSDRRRLRLRTLPPSGARLLDGISTPPPPPPHSPSSTRARARARARGAPPHATAAPPRRARRPTRARRRRRRGRRACRRRGRAAAPPDARQAGGGEARIVQSVEQPDSSASIATRSSAEGVCPPDGVRREK